MDQATVTQIVLSVCLLQLNTVTAVDSLVVSLDGTPGTADYMQVDSGLLYQLKCQYRAGYDDKVSRISWHLFGMEVYSYSVLANSTSVSPPLRGLVDLSPKDSPQNIHITRAELSLTGTYTCVVTSTKGVLESDVLHVKVIHIASGTFETSVDVLSNILEQSSDNSTTTTVSPPSTTTKFGPPGPPTPDPSCVLVWGFKTPAISPRPNVTCGYYSYSHDDIKEVVAGGLQLHQLQDNSWRAEINNTKIPVIEIPYQGRLGCSITIPSTSYRKMVKFEDGLSVDHLIDSKGCPTLQGLTDYFEIRQSVSGASPSCRGDLVPSSKVVPVRATLSCPHASRFRDGRISSGWEMVISCSYSDMIWREISVTDDRVRNQIGLRNNGAFDGSSDDTTSTGVNTGDMSMQSGDPSSDSTGMMMNGRKIGDIIDIENYPWPLCVEIDQTSSSGVTTLQLSLMIFTSVANVIYVSVYH